MTRVSETLKVTGRHHGNDVHLADRLIKYSEIDTPIKRTRKTMARGTATRGVVIPRFAGIDGRHQEESANNGGGSDTWKSLR